ncbi:MAG: hypothetical protein D6687_09875 [Acidobacteria bacterium]|jgi:hypothetical protein|nr:MAG: hypothetical protein D6687_09875 [Acidobacteriota bacterium]GIU81231.1 MAG: hypothetical protein KatS3mg006_0295 [Pyrinomonadaceae bacterium]
MNTLTEETRRRLKNLSRAMIRFHKILLDDAKAEYETRNGKIENVYVYYQLVLEDKHFAWLRRISYMIALIDEATSSRHPATESEAQELFNKTRLLLSFEDEDEDFNDKLQAALTRNYLAVLSHNEILRLFE